MGDIGLILGLGMDTSGAEEAAQAFLPEGEGGIAKSSQKLAQSVADASGGIDKNLLSNRESVRLLSEEMGIHLPRAVSVSARM